MELIDNFYIDGDNRIQLNTHRLVVRDYKTKDKTEFTDSEYYVNEAGMKEWTENLIPKHQLLELIDNEEIDTSDYAWMCGIKLKSDNHAREIEEIASYGSYEAYEASLPETQDAFNMDVDYRLSKIELGI